MGAEPSAPAPFAALDTLEQRVHALADELAFFRRRALDAERRLRDVLGHQAATVGGAAAQRSSELDLTRLGALELENAELRARIIEAADRARAVASRMRFARQQDDAAAVDGGG
ncbi:hypothetical protein tb265_36850 [Gemmatimonadetes bacterium T265]|nr:hypothetical protein tb265_36850 [Gemmatimonadetes bacterium T265]